MPQLKLKNASGMLFDPRTGFTIVREQVVPKPARITPLMKRWLSHGALIEIPDPTGEPPAPAAAPAAHPTVKRSLSPAPETPKVPGQQELAQEDHAASPPNGTPAETIPSDAELESMAHRQRYILARQHDMPHTVKSTDAVLDFLRRTRDGQ